MAENIIFRIGSKLGPGGLSSLKAGLDMIKSIIGGIVSAGEELDKFQQVWKNTNQQAVIMADTAATGLVDTAAIIKQQNALIVAGVKTTDEQFKTLVVRAAQMAQKTGGDATAAFEKLTGAIIRGGRGLQEYGIKATASSSLLRDQQKIIKTLTEGYEDQKVEAETLTEAVFGLGNNWGTFLGHVHGLISLDDSVVSVLNRFNTSFGELNILLAESPEAMSDMLFSLEGMTGFLAEIQLLLIGIVETLGDPFIKGLTALTGIDVGSGIESYKRGAESLAVAPWESSSEARSKERQAGLKLEEKKKRKNEIEMQRLRKIAMRGKKGKSPKFDLGEEQPDLNRFTSSDEVSQLFSDYEQLYGNNIVMMEQVRTQFAEFVKERADIEANILEQELAMSEEKMLAEEQAQQESFDRVKNNGEEYFAWLDQQHEQELALNFDYQQMQKEIELQHYAELNDIRYSENQRALGIDQSHAIASAQIWKSSTQGKMEITSQFFGAIAGLMNTESEKLFNIGKVGAIAEAGVNTALGAIKAFQAMSGIPIVGPALGAIAAGIVTATGIATIAKIKAQKFRGGSTGGASISTGSVSGSSGVPMPSQSTPSFTPTQAEQKPVVHEIRLREGATEQIFEVVIEENERAEINDSRGFQSRRGA